ncbi:MAG: substrate-binding domain-containing protein, partial [Gammaproteobacteria bacterium]|nr:substrate-binding domain-containing protein [Gammaproteobacteria bacterium]
MTTSFTARAQLLLFILFNLLCTIVYADDKAINKDNKPAIIGAGAHFAWVIFNDLKPALQQSSGRTVELFGKESMLGMGCNAGIKMAQQNQPGKESFGFVCCPLSDKEVHEKDIQVHPIAKEPILILVNKQNKVQNLSQQQVSDIFSGKITNWAEVEGEDKPVVVVTRLHCKHRPGHWKTILPDAKSFRKDRLNVKSAAEMVKRVTDFPGAIGHTGATWVFGSDSNVKSVSVSGFSPTAGNLRAGRYPFYRVLSAVTNKQASADVMAIIDRVQTGPEFSRVAKE